MADQSHQAHKALIEATRTIREYAGSDSSKNTITLLDALYDSYCIDLINVKPEGLIAIQSALKQVSLLRDVFANDGQDIPKI